MIANLEENEKDKSNEPDRLSNIINKSFLTKSGKDLAENILLKKSEN
jgi:hypothetical protein